MSTADGLNNPNQRRTSSKQKWKNKNEDLDNNNNNNNNNNTNNNQNKSYRQFNNVSKVKFILSAIHYRISQ